MPTSTVPTSEVMAFVRDDSPLQVHAGMWLSVDSRVGDRIERRSEHAVAPPGDGEGRRVISAEPTDES